MLAGAVCSRVGDTMEAVIRSWLVWQLTGSAFWLGFMVFCHWLPNLSLSMFAGVLADRLDNRKVIMFCESLYMSSALAMGILTVAGVVNLWQIGGLLFLHGLAAAIAIPSRQVFVYDMVGKERLISAVSLTNSLFQCMQFVGPAVAGLLIVSLGPGIAYLVNGALFVPAIVTVGMIRVEKQHRQPAEVSPWTSTGQGLRHVRNSPLLLGLLALATFPAILIGDSVAAMMPIFATEILHVGADGMGFLLSANGLGAITAAVLISYLGGLRRKGTMVIVTSTLFGVFVLAFSQSSWYAVSLVILVGVGMTAVTSQTVISTSLQMASPDDMRGRVAGIYSLGTLGVRAFNGPMIGAFAAAVGAPLALGVLGGLVSVSVMVIAAFTPERRKLG